VEPFIAFFKSSTKKTNRQKDDGVRKLKEGQYTISKKKTFLPTYRPCFWRVGRPRGNIHLFKCGL